MSRPTVMKVDGTVFWTLMTYDADGVLVDADSTPTVAVRKNNASVGDAVTVTKRSATTGIYDCSHNPAGEAVGDTFTYEETATMSSQAYVNSWQVKVTPNVSDIWSEPSVGYTVGGTMGNIMKNRPDIQDIVDGVWDEPASSHLAAGTFGDNLDVRLSDFLGDNMGYYVWDHLLANINTAGSVGVRVKDLHDFDPVNDAVANVTLVGTTTANLDMRGTDSALLASAAPTNWSIMAINGSGEITTSNPASGGGSAHTAEDVRDLILAGDKTPITMAANKVSNVVLVDTTTNLTNGSGGDSAADIYAYFISGNNEDAFKADVSGLATQSSVNTIDSNVDAILADTNELQLNQNNWLTATGFATPADVFSSQVIVTSAIDALNDFNPLTDTVAHVTLVDTTTDLTNQSDSEAGAAPRAF